MSVRLLCALGFLFILAAETAFGLEWSTCSQPVAPWTQYQQMHGAAVLNGYIYCIGGTIAASTPPQGASGAANDTFSTYYARIISPGVTSTWTTCTAQLPVGASYASDPEFAFIARHANTYGGRIYITGGNSNRSGIAERNTVCYAEPTATGNITSWSLQPVAGNSIARWEHTSVIDQATGKLYVIGGGSSATPSRQIDVAQIASNGMVSSFATAGQLAVGVNQAAAVIHNGYLYVLGGNRGTNGAATLTQRLAIQTGGALAPVVTNDMAALPEARYDNIAATVNGEVYVMGGCVSGDSTIRSAVHRAGFGAGGAITSWSPDTPLPHPVRRAPVVNTGTTLYILGGRSSATQLTNTLMVSVPVAGVECWPLY